jgi:hypothetical protein
VRYCATIALDLYGGCRHDNAWSLPWLNAIGLFVLLFDSRPVLAQAIDIDAARKEGKVIAYGTIIPQVMEPLHRNLEKKYGIKVEYWRASATQVMERALSEW